MAIDNALKNPVVTSVLAVKSGDDFVAVGENSKLPVEATHKALPITFSSATLQSTSDECVISCGDYKSGSFTVQTSASASLTLTLYAVVDGVDAVISFCASSFNNTSVFSSLPLGSNISGLYVFEVPVGATSIKLKLTNATLGNVAVKVYLSEYAANKMAVKGTVSLLPSAFRVGFTARSAVWTRESTTPVNANITIIGAAKTTFTTSSGTPLNSTVSYGDKFAAAAGANVVGTLVIDASPDSGTTYYPVASVALTQIGGAGNFGAYLEAPIVEATMRARLVNGASNQANTYLTTKMLG